MDSKLILFIAFCLGFVIVVILLEMDITKVAAFSTGFLFGLTLIHVLSSVYNNELELTAYEKLTILLALSFISLYILLNVAPKTMTFKFNSIKTVTDNTEKYYD
jgi:hypothetical protein